MSILLYVLDLYCFFEYVVFKKQKEKNYLLFLKRKKILKYEISIIGLLNVLYMFKNMEQIYSILYLCTIGILVYIECVKKRNLLKRKNRIRRINKLIKQYNTTVNNCNEYIDNDYSIKLLEIYKQIEVLKLTFESREFAKRYFDIECSLDEIHNNMDTSKNLYNRDILMEEYLELFDLSFNTLTIDVLKKKYKEYVKKYHPDKHNGIDKFNFSKFNEAYEYLYKKIS